MHKAAVFGVLVLSAAPGAAQAWEFRARWVERVGADNLDIQFVGGVQTIVVDPGSSHTYRIQFGVFDTPGSPAPAGGLIGWNAGYLDFTGGATQANIRISPFTFAPGGNGVLANPDVTLIDATQGCQVGFWDWDPKTMMPGPLPEPTIYGLNTFIDVFSIGSVAGTSDYSVIAAGREIAATGWTVTGPPPDQFNHHIQITLCPEAAQPAPFTHRLDILVPAPSAGAVLALGGLVASRRRTRIS